MAAGHTKLGKAPDVPQGHAAILRDLNRMEKWAGTNLLKSDDGKCKGLHLGRNNAGHQDVLGADKKNSKSSKKYSKPEFSCKLNLKL